MSKIITFNNKPRIRLTYLFISIISVLFGRREPSFQKSLFSEGTVIFGGWRGGGGGGEGATFRSCERL